MRVTRVEMFTHSVAGASFVYPSYIYVILKSCKASEGFSYTSPRLSPSPTVLCCAVKVSLRDERNNVVHFSFLFVHAR